MAGPISVRCPKCKTKLKLKNRSAVGKKVPCPKCKQPFVVKLPKKPKPKPKPVPVEEVDDDFGVLDEFDSFEDSAGEFDDDYGAPAAAAAPPPVVGRKKSSGKKKKASSKKKKAKSGQWKKPAIIGGGVLLALLLLIALLFLFLGGDKQAVAQAEEQNRIDLAYLPDDVEVVVRIRLSELWGTPIIQKVRQNEQASGQIKQFRNAFPAFADTELSDVSTVTVGVSGFSEATKLSRSLMQSVDITDPEKMAEKMQKLKENQQAVKKIQHVVTVVRISKSFNTKERAATLENSESKTHNKTTYYVIPPAAPQQDAAAMFFPNDKTIVFGSESDIQSAIERGDTQKRRREFDFVDPDQHLLVAIVPKDKSILNADISTEGSGMTSMFAGLIPESLRTSRTSKRDGLSIGLTVSDNIALQFRSNCPGADEATAAKSESDSVIAELKKAFAKKKKSMQKQMPKITEVASKFLDSLAVTQSENTVELTATVPESLTAAAEELPLIMGQMMMGGRLPGGTPGGGSGGPDKPTSLGDDGGLKLGNEIPGLPGGVPPKSSPQEATPKP